MRKLIAPAQRNRLADHRKREHLNLVRGEKTQPDINLCLAETEFWTLKGGGNKFLDDLAGNHQSRVTNDFSSDRLLSLNLWSHRGGIEKQIGIHENPTGFHHGRWWSSSRFSGGTGSMLEA